jgi:hypothetical protein
MPVAQPKVLVAVHGIGNQIGYATVQTVASQLGTYYGICPAIPLGRFYPAAAGSGPIRPMPALMMAPPDPAPFVGLGFAEVYWAGIAREVSKDGYILEETKAWARTIAARVSLRASGTQSGLPTREHDRLVSVLDEMIDTVFVLERLTSIAKVAGVFSFNLRALLAEFLGDVQIVSEFVAYRHRILDEFDTVMTQTTALSPATDIYVVAHSEGSVVALLALLSALSDSTKYPWITSVRGFMTIGSPIETHVVLWPQLWTDFKPDTSLPSTFTIPWHNYLDAGDPIAYPLEQTKQYLHDTKLDERLSLVEHEYSRSYLPGKAHVDYWTDTAVFRHFLSEVVQLPRAAGQPSKVNPPRTKLSAVWVSYVIPHLIVAAVFLLGTYLLYRPVEAALGSDYSAALILGDVTGIGLLLLGLTAAARIPRLTDRYRWWFVSVACLAAAMATYRLLVSPATRARIGELFAMSPAAAWIPSTGVSIAGVTVDQSTMATFAAVALVALVSGTLASWFHRLGTRVLPILGAVLAAVLVAFILDETQQQTDLPVWPVVVGLLGFFYLWWLGALLFDLVFVWHRYVRHAAAMREVSALAKTGYAPPPTVRCVKHIKKLTPVKQAATGRG